ncbi:MAG: glucans biosynthesis glucosyltransferase MdoH [Rhodobacterales bacterium]|nr:MAG: glucans biosynthesis glucosyltransferase MdoH [Rhodobacterales bacterium]
MGGSVTVALRQVTPAESALPRLAMPNQDLRAPFRDPQAPGIRSSGLTLVFRALVLLVPLGVTVTLGWLSLGWFALDGRLTLAEAALVGVTSFAFYWVALSVGTATLGLFWRERPLAEPLHGLKVAILLPMYGEPAEETIGHAVRLLAGLQGKGRHSFTLQILSDTRALAAALLEEAAVANAVRLHSGLIITYRRRAANTDYKSGNIRSWVQAHGAEHDAMLILDADSIMGPATVLQLADALAQDPGLGLIQTVPRVLPGRTLWQGLQSFASEVYGVNMGRGLAMWAGVTGNFLGHNALIRTRAFAASAGLPHLPGKAPRGGVILSHDFVEAALLRRAGWGVRMMPEAAESFEDTPETLTGYLRRDQRWCQGNLQHLRLLMTPGLHPLSRFHLLQGAMAYLSSVWWLALLILWALPGQGRAMPDVFAKNPLLPSWPTLPPLTQGAIAGLVGVMLVAPKLLGIASHIRRHGLALTDGPRFVGLVLAEVFLSALLAPALMVHQVRAVWRTFRGLDGGWMPHVAGRSDLRTLLRFHTLETGLGASLLSLAVAGQLSLWLLPVAVSLCLTVPLAAVVQLPLSAFQIRMTRRRVA